MTAVAGRVAARTTRRQHVGRLTVAVVLVVYVLLTHTVAETSSYTQSLVLVAAVFGILAVSLDLVAGMAGLYSLGHAGLFALGAYATTLLNQQLDWNVFVLLPVCLIGVGLVGIVLGALSFRVSGLYFAITTFVFTLVVGVLASDLQITGGLQGLPGPTFPDFPYSVGGFGTALVWCIGACLLVTVGAVWCIRRSAFYPVLLAVRDAEPFAAANGVRTRLVKVLVFGVSAAMAGMAGWAFSFLGFISPGQFSWTVSVNILVMVILGGMNTTWGPLIGAAFISVFPVYVHIDPLVQELIFGAIFVLVIVFAPGGIVGVISRFGRFLGGGRASTAPLSAAEADEGAVDTAALRTASPPVSAVAVDPDVPAVECRGIRFSYVPGVPVLDDVDFVVRPGTIHGLIGPNGSGKSTLVNLIAGQLGPQEGGIRLHGTHVERLAAATRPAHGLRRTFQTAVLVRELRARDNVAIGLYSTTPRVGRRSPVWPMLPSGRRDSRTAATRAGAALDAVGMTRWSDARVADVPHGVEQLTQLAAACIGEPSVLLLDEPLAGLSTGEVAAVSAILADLKRAGVSVIVIEHQTTFVFEVCDDVTVLAAGALVTSGPAGEVRVDPRVREVYLGQ
jgi:branched-chain amino acid transport system permease protein